ncbi:MAG: hypothetical protein LW865_01760 [Betaproteobacteria bacterium]|nr:hypothetical protein [Betaproteobacteria bacterium]
MFLMNQPLITASIHLTTQAEADYMRERMIASGQDVTNVEWLIDELATAIDPLAIASGQDLDRSYAAAQAVLKRLI